jgi:hypothetical protein
MEHSEYFKDDKECNCVLNDDNEVFTQQSEKQYNGNTASTKDDRSHEFLRNNCNTFTGVKENQSPDILIDDKRELPENECDNEGAIGSSCVLPCLAMTHPKTDDVTSSQGSRINKVRTDDRMISAEQLRAKVCEGNRL